MYQGFSLSTPSLKSALVDRALEEESLLLLGAGRHSIRLRPHLHVSTADVDLLVKKLSAVLSRLTVAV